jgi:hypothetical protein
MHSIYTSVLSEMCRQFVFPLHVRVQFGTEHGEREHDPAGGQEWSGIGVQHCHSLHHLFYGHHEEKSDSKRPDVGGRGVVTTVTVDLWCPIRIGTDSLGTGSQNLPRVLRYRQDLVCSKISEFEVKMFVQNTILRFYVPVKDASFVEVHYSQQNLCEVMSRQRLWKITHRFNPLKRSGDEKVEEIGSATVLEHDKPQTANQLTLSSCYG